MKPIVIIILCALCTICLIACRAKQKVFESIPDTVYIHRIVPVTLPGDTATLKALLKCNTDGLVAMDRIETETTRNMRLMFKLDSIGNLSVRAYTQYDTIYLPADSVVITTTVTRNEYIQTPLSTWEKVMMKIGNVSIWVFVGAVILGAVLLFIKR